MSSKKGQLVIRYAGDTRDLEKANKRGVADVKDFGNKAGAAAAAAGKAAGSGFGDKFEAGAKAGNKKAVTGFNSPEFTAAAKGAGKKAGDGFGDKFTAGVKTAGKDGADDFSSGLKLTISKADAVGKGAGKGFAGRFKSEAKTAGKEGAEGFSSSLKVGAVAGAAAAGGAAAMALGDAMEKEKLNDKVAASLNLTGGQAKKAGKVAARLYAGAWGENMGEVSDAVESVMSSIDGMANASPRRLKKITAGVMDLASAFDSDAQTAARDLGILIKNGLARDATHALDLITATMQKVPKAMRGDVSDAIEEYAKDFAQLGFTGKQSMELLVSSTSAGKYGIDKMGDSIKEFALRVIDGSTSTDEAFTAIGMDTDEMADKFLKGGEVSKKAFKKTVQGLLDIENPSKRARAAVKLFGTPLEDLGVQGIPKFLESLLEAEGGLGKVEGRSKKMGDTLNDNVSTKFTEAKRKAQTFLTDGLVALYEGFDTGKAKGDGFAGAMSEAGAALKPLAETIRSITEIPGFNKLAGQVAAIGAAVITLNAVYKFSGLSWLIDTGFPGLKTKAAGALGPIGLVLAGIIALDEWQASKDPDYKSMMDLFVDFPKDPWKTVKTSLKQNAPKLLDFIPGMSSVKPMLQALAAPFGTTIRKMRNVTERFAPDVGAAFQRMKTSVTGKLRGLRSDSGALWGKIRTGQKIDVAAAARNAVSGFGNLRSGAVKKLRGLREDSGALFGKIRSNASDKARATSEAVRRTFGDMKEKGSKKLREFKESAGTIFARIRSYGSDKARGLSEAVRRTFGDMKDKAGKKFREFWNGLRQDAAKPVKFIVRTVWNKGLRKMLNSIPGVEIKPTTLAFAKGGAVHGPGSETSDSISARLSRNEHVWTAREVKAAGGHNRVEELRRAALSGNFKHSDPGFAEGGGVTPEAVARAQKFARGQAGKPYGWGAVGPGAYDCSGFMSAITNVLRGMNPYSRVGATADFPWSGFKKGPGQFTIGSSPNFSGGIGHMAGNLGGLGVESRGGRGVILGQGAMPPSRFGSVYHLGKGGNFGSGGGGNWWDDLKSITSGMARLPGQIADMMASDSWINPFLKKMVQGVAGDVASFINKKIPDIGPIKTNPVKVPTFDRGGTLSPGYNTIYNGLGRPESLRPSEDVGMGGRQVVEVSLDGALGEMLMKEIRKQVKAGGGDPVYVLTGGRRRL